jgi:hypothetical protein
MKSFASHPRRSLRPALALLLAAGLGCASTQVQPGQQYGGGLLPRPSMVFVYPFASAPEDVKLDWSPTVQAAWRLEGETTPQEKLRVGRSVARALATKLVTKIDAMGLPAQEIEGDLPGIEGPKIVIYGHFLAINEGNRAERVVIGLGAGRSDVKTAVQVFEVVDEGRRVVDEFVIDAKSGRKPGAAETLGVGGAAGNLAVSGAVTAAGTVASEAFGDDVDADAERTAAKVASVLQTFFARQGWVAPKKSLF